MFKFMNEKMYYYLSENKLLTHGIGDISDKETYFKFESIIKNGGLMSLQKLKELGINVSGRVSGLRDTPESRISFFNPSTTEIKKRLLSDYFYYFLPFNHNVIFFIIDGTNIDLQQHPDISFEITTESGFVSIDNFKGIIAPSECIEYINSIHNKYGICLPIYDFDFNMMNDLNDGFNKHR